MGRNPNKVFMFLFLFLVLENQTHTLHMVSKHFSPELLALNQMFSRNCVLKISILGNPKQSSFLPESVSWWQKCRHSSCHIKYFFINPVTHLSTTNASFFLMNWRERLFWVTAAGQHHYCHCLSLWEPMEGHSESLRMVSLWGTSVITDKSIFTFHWNWGRGLICRVSRWGVHRNWEERLGLGKLVKLWDKPALVSDM